MAAEPPPETPPAETPSGAPSADKAARAWAGLQAFMGAQDHHRRLREAFDFGRGLGRVTALLHLADGPLTLREIAEANGVDAPYATVIVDKLESRGLVERTPHPDDQRRKLVVLTDAGREAVALAQRILAEPPAALTALPDRDLDALLGVLERLGQA